MQIPIRIFDEAVDSDRYYTMNDMNMSTMNRISTLLGFLLVSILGKPVHALSVSLQTQTPDFCQFGSGALSALVDGGTPPYVYDWYEVTDVGETPLCMGCGSVEGGMWDMRSYKVVVTDALGAVAEETGYVAGMAGLWVDVNWLPYLPGSPPVILITSTNSFDQFVHPEIGVEPAPLNMYIAEQSSGESFTDRAVLPVGTTQVSVGGWVTSAYGTCTRDAWSLIGPPTILPDIDVVEVHGSCSNADNGSLEVAFANGANTGSLSVLMRPEGSPNEFLTNYYAGEVGVAASVKTFSGFAPGNYWLIVTGQPPSLSIAIPGYTYDCRDSVFVTIPDLGPTCGVVSGTVFLDTDLNCMRLYTEPGIPNTVLEVLPGPYYATTNNSGTYDLVLPNGSYTIREQSVVVNEHCTATPIPFTISGGAAAVTVNHPTTSLVPLDVQVSLSSGAARPGFEFAYDINVRNNTVSNTGTVTVTMQRDPSLIYLGATPPPTTVSGTTLSWTLTAMPTYQQRNITVRTQVPADVALLGTDLVSTASVSTALADGNLANNSATNTRTVTGSYDPNDKLAYTSSGSTTHYDPSQDQWIDYTIRFQNTGTDTAFHILITDTLAANLDPSSLIMGAGSHTFGWEVEGEGTLKFRLYNILLPDSNVNEPRSHGFVSFRIKPRSPLSAGAQIINRANIFFDFNPPVITDPSVLTVPTPPVLVSPRVFLGGNYSASTPPMTDALRLLNKVPRVEPYSDLGYVHQGTGGGETATPASFLVTGNDAVVDWVVVELRGTSGAGSVVASRAALLQRDGDVVGPNGSSPVAFHVPSGGSYRIAVRHRNHLGVMTSTARTLTTNTSVVDFTLAATATYGTNARNTVGGSMVLWPGDTNGDGVAKYTGSFNDRDIVLQGIGGTVPTNIVNNVYDNRDVNLNGNIMYTGTGNDRDVILQAIGGTVPTAVRTQQLP